MVVVPAWRDEDPEDEALPAMVDALLGAYGGVRPGDGADLRPLTQATAAAIAGAVARAEERRARARAPAEAAAAEEEAGPAVAFA